MNDLLMPCENCENMFDVESLRETDDMVTLCPVCWQVVLKDNAEMALEA